MFEAEKRQDAKDMIKFLNILKLTYKMTLQLVCVWVC